ncbi:MAG: hypothetical protein WBG50_11300, partial [Desulfomonilaceae bacterium]
VIAKLLSCSGVSLFGRGGGIEIFGFKAGHLTVGLYRYGFFGVDWRTESTSWHSPLVRGFMLLNVPVDHTIFPRLTSAS